jgi:hypothetical protein
MKIIQLKDEIYKVHHCGQCPFFEYDSFRGEYHKCKAVTFTLYVDILGIPKACPLLDEPNSVKETIDKEVERSKRIL